MLETTKQTTASHPVAPFIFQPPQINLVKTKRMLPRAPHWRRMLAAVIDRLLPQPWLAFFFPGWTLIVLAYHLLCDASPERRSVGKWWCRLRVIDGQTATRGAWWQAVLRRVGTATAQVAWCVPEWMFYALAYDLVALAFLLLSPQAQRPEDFLAGTAVITESVYGKDRGKEKS